MLHRVRTFELSKFVDFFVCSCFVHLRKPDPDIFQLALDVGRRGDRSLYIMTEDTWQMRSPSLHATPSPPGS